MQDSRYPVQRLVERPALLLGNSRFYDERIEYTKSVS